MANRNRNAGNGYERKIVNELKGMNFPSVITSRSESRNMDNAGVDIFDTKQNPNEGERILPVHIQCKNSKTNVNYHKLLTSEDLPDDKDTVIFHKKTEKVGNRFYGRGEYVIMKKETFYDLLNHKTNEPMKKQIHKRSKKEINQCDKIHEETKAQDKL